MQDVAEAGVAGRVASILSLRPAGLVADFEGTLIPVGGFDDERRTASLQAVLQRLASSLAVVAVVSGRPVAELSRMIGAPGVLYIGNHGLEWQREGRRYELTPPASDVEHLERAAQLLRSFLRVLDGVRLERSTYGLSISYRAAPFQRWTRTQILKLVNQLESLDLRVLEGRRVVELRPRATPGKAHVVATLAADFQLRGLVYLGDDRMDLGAFEATRGLREQRRLQALNIAVLNDEAPASVPESADISVANPGEVSRLLASVSAAAAGEGRAGRAASRRRGSSPAL